jgi:hypothetical protein
MDDHEHISNGIQKFDGRNYAYWSDRVKTYLTALGVDIWYSVVNGYVIPNNAPTDPNEKKLMSCNSKARHVILASLTPTIASKVMGCNTAKEVWDKLKNIYEGDPKVKQVKLQRHRAEFENLKMNEKEDIATYLLRVDEVVNAIRGLGEAIDESLVVQKVLRSLLLKYDAKVSAIEETRDLTKMTMDELHGTLMAYEMRTGTESDQTNNEAAFKAIKKTKDKDNDLDEEIANFVRRFQKGSGRYKGKSPLKCFNCGRIGHIVENCYYKKRSLNNKKSFYSKDDDISSDESDEEDNGGEVLFITQENQDDDHKNSKEEEIICEEDSDEETNLDSFWGYKDNAESEQEDENLEKLKHVETENSKLRNTNIILKGELSSCEEENYKLQKTINSLKEQLEDYEKLKAELDHTKGELLLTTKRLKKFEKSTEKLDEILSSQRSPNDKTGLGYNDSLKTTKQEKEVENDETNTPERVEQQDRKIEFRRNETSRRSSPIRYESNHYEGNYRRIDCEPRWTTPQRRSLTPRYQNFFLGHCYTCGNFGHKAINCRINERNNYASYMNGENSRYENVRRPFNRNYNPFDPLMDQNIVCYKCNNLGHKARDCRKMKEDNHMPNVCIPTTTWKRKEIPHNENFRIALVAKECKEEDEWLIDSGCSSHMTGDQSKFVSLKKKGGNVAFGDDSSTKILGKGIVKLGSENVKAGKVLLVEDLKHNLLSVSKMCDQGYTLTFDSRKCKIRENNSGRLVATATRRPNNIYILDMKKREKTEATQKDSKEENVPKTKNKDEVLLSATCLGGAAPKKKVTFFH